jgi:glycosyltransferase involved in cell wall biosynthesis
MSLQSLFSNSLYSISETLKLKSSYQKNATVSHRSTTTSHFLLTLLIQFFPPDYAPTGQLIDELTRALDVHDMNIEVFTAQPSYAYQSSSSPRRDVHGKVLVRRSRATQFWPQRIRGKAVAGILFFMRSVLHLIKTPKSNNLILLTTAPAFLPMLAYFAHFLKLPYVLLIYDLYPDIAIELGVIPPHHWLSRLWRSANSQIWRKARNIIVLSPAMKQAIIRHCPEVADNISIIHSWSDPNFITPIPKHQNKFALEHHLDSQFTVLYSGNMGSCHDMDTILEAALYLRDYPIQFVFIGGGSQRQEFIRQVDQLGLTNCLFLPYQPKEVLPYSLTACDVSLVSVSLGMETFVAPSKLYSALAAGRPIAAVCPTHSYLNQLITDAHCGGVFENGDGRGLAKYIRHLSMEPQSVEDLGANGRRYLQKHFTIDVIAKQYYQVFRQAVIPDS